MFDDTMRVLPSEVVVGDRLVGVIGYLIHRPGRHGTHDTVRSGIASRHTAVEMTTEFGSVFHPCREAFIEPDGLRCVAVGNDSRNSMVRRWPLYEASAV